MRHTRLEVVANGVGNGATEDDQIEKRVRTETVCAMDRNTSRFSTSKQTWHYLILAVLVNADDLTSVFSRDTAHVVVDSGQNWNRLFGDVDAGKDGSGL